MAIQAWLTQGLTDARDQIKTLVTHLILNDDATAFAAGQTTADPGGSTLRIAKTVTEADVDTVTTDFTCAVNGGTDGTGTINSICLAKGSLDGDVVTRYVRTNGIGLEAGDVFTIGLRNSVADLNA